MADLSVAYDVERAFGCTFEMSTNINVLCPWCETAESRSPSCSVCEMGIFNCKSCKVTGDIFDFYSQTMGVTLTEAKLLLVRDGDKPQHKRRKPGTLDDVLIDKCHDLLLRHSQFRNYLHQERGLTTNILRQFRIGCDEYRITIPIFDPAGQPTNIRRYRPHASKSPKMVSHRAGDGHPRLYPVSSLLTPGSIILCEGEWDALLLIQKGFNAITTTGGAGAWKPEWSQALAGRHVIIIFDVNDKERVGDIAAEQRAQELLGYDCTVQIVKLPLDNVGGDITDYFVKYSLSGESLSKLITKTPYITASTTASTTATEVPQDEVPSVASAEPASGRCPTAVTLNEAADSKYFFQPITMRCMVAGKGTAPYLVPKKFELRVQDKNGDGSFFDCTFNDWDGRILALLDCSRSSQKRILASMFGIPPTSEVTVKVHEAMNIEEIYLAPNIDDEQEQGEYTLRKCYYLGHGIDTNKVYDFTGYTLPHPRTQQATHVLVNAVPSETMIDNFVLSEDDVNELRGAFSSTNPHDKLGEIAGDLAQSVTHIYGRDDLHIAVDLVLFSPLSFVFNGLLVNKGWLEALIIGDTRTGKGFVAEGLLRHYQAGEVVSGENVSMAGLVGGIQKLGDRFTLVWGRIPLSDRRAVVIDECGSLSYSDIGRLSRIRSEGIAEITKIITEKTRARCRLIWIGNPRPWASGAPRRMSDYNYGVEAAAELIGAAEDMARFDFVFTVAKNEVDAKLINQRMSGESSIARYPRELHRKLLMWVWSRLPDQVVFSDDAVAMILKASQDLGRRFSSRLCLIQYEDVRFKLARLAAASAGRLFSTDDGIVLSVNQTHVTFAYNFLYHIYHKESCQYVQLSDAERERSTLRNEKQVLEILELAGDSLSDLVDGLLEQRRITARDLSDYAAIDLYQARSLISDLVRHRAITKEQYHYVKKPAFKIFLQRTKSTLGSDHYTATEESDVSI